MKKIAIISGVTGDIGEAIAKELLQNDIFVVGLYNKNIEKAKELEINFGIKTYQIDITSESSIENTIKKVIRDFHNIDILINNAGISNQMLFTDMTEKDIDYLLNTNLKGTMLLTKAILPYMINNKYGKVINISSIWGVFGGSCEVAYSASKAGLIGFTKALSRELGPCSINVNAVAPGFIDTKMNGHINENDKKAFSDGLSLQKIGKPADVAYLVGFLAGEKSNYITGQTICIDGGF